MKDIAYFLIKQSIRLGCYCYFKKIEMHDLAKIPEKKPILILANHQNALLDALLVAVSSKHRPYFLTRSDVFSNPCLRALFKLLRMLPVYRIRDGIHELAKNSVTFDRCAALLEKNQSILIFPEGNHSLARCIRPLNKGFTRIILTSLSRHPHLDIRLVPLGINYQDAASFPDSAAFYFGADIPVQDYYEPGKEHIFVQSVKEKVATELKQVTTHIGDVDNYEEIRDTLNRLGANYLEPKKVNEWIRHMPSMELNRVAGSRTKKSSVMATLFSILNFPLLWPWRAYVSKKVPEPEFKSSYRFLYAFMVFPLYYLLLLLILWALQGYLAALGGVMGLFLFNLYYVKQA